MILVRSGQAVLVKVFVRVQKLLPGSYLSKTKASKTRVK